MSQKKSDLSNFPRSQIKVAKDNDLIYSSFALANQDDAELLQSIMAQGIVEPLVVSTDGFLLSGHRRFAAAKLLRLETVPVRFHEVVFESLAREDRLKLLAVFNRQRDKSFDEKTAERLVEIDPKVARSQLFLKRIERDRQPISIETNVELGEVKHRASITTMAFAAAVQKIVKDNERFLPLTDRRIHYLLLNDPPLRHDKKTERYRNDIASYKALTNLLVRMRLNRMIPMDAVEDPTRPVTGSIGFQSADAFVAQELESLLRFYNRNLMQDQPIHLEIVLEKAALRSVVMEVAWEYCVSLTVGRGFCSLSPRHDLALRYKNSGKRDCVLLFLTDFDPDGEAIAASFARSMRDDFGLRHVIPHKVLLNQSDVIEFDLPADLDAKPSSPNYQKFVEKFGTQATELDALPADLIQARLRQAIENVIDIDTFQRQVDEETRDAALLQAKREAILNFVGRHHG
ncbi:MAG: chromosome partitioning protein ParB [Betaproteobacteria bacterium]|nr:chromosome partitioning protein ParB [Betaproteobacteria bacterium]